MDKEQSYSAFDYKLGTIEGAKLAKTRDRTRALLRLERTMNSLGRGGEGRGVP